jgi:hypothetical protein
MVDGLTAVENFLEVPTPKYAAVDRPYLPQTGDVVQEGIDLAFRRRGYPSVESLRTKR